MERQYFDNTLLAQFYVTKMPLSVYVEGDLLKIVDADDITDPFMGSGTTSKMCILDKRNYIGSELSKEYCDIEKERLSLINKEIKN